MKSRTLVVALLIAVGVGLAPSPAWSSDNNRYIVRIKSGLDGLGVIRLVCNLVGCNVVRSLDGDPAGGDLQQGSLFLVDSLLPLDLGDLLTPLLRLLGVASAEPDLTLSLTEEYRVRQESAAVVDYLSRRTPTSYYGTTVWAGYLEQPAVGIVRLRDAHCAYRVTGAGIVAVIDTGVDPSHPALANVLVPGYDFTRNAPGADETSDVQQESAMVVDGSYDPTRVNQESAFVADQESAMVVDDPAHAAYGHGTMSAGVVHLTAPTARILPLKAFHADGTGYTSDILRAIYYGVRKGAKVLSMSFSSNAPSAEMKRALDYAAAVGVVPVSSAGNDGTNALRWPAAYDKVMGVASTSNEDVRSSFSNYGASLVWLAAPGEGVITTYPGGSYAAVWGTSFSTPFVSGTAALLAQMRTTATYSQASWALSNAKRLTSDLGYGRLDSYKAVGAAKLLWPFYAGSSVEGCEVQ
jgi:hypothetical protein